MKSRWFVLLTIIIFTLTIGCSDKGKPEGEKKDDKGKTEKKDEPKKDEPKKDEPKKDEPKVDEPKVDEVKTGIVPTSSIALVDGLVLSGSLAPVKGSIAKATDLLSPEMKGWAEKSIYEEAVVEIAREMRFKDLAWLDLNKSVKGGIVDLSSFVVVIPITSSEAFFAAVPAEGLEKFGPADPAKDGARRLVKDGLVLEVRKDALYLGTETGFDQIGSEVFASLAASGTDEVASVTLKAESFLPALIPEMERGLAEMLEFLPEDNSIRSFYTNLFDYVKSGIAQLDLLTMKVDLSGSDLVYKIGVTAKPDTTFAGILAKTKAAPLTSLELMPANPYLVGAQNISPDVFGDWIESYMEIVLGMYQLKPEDAKALAQDYVKLMKMVTGEYAFAMYVDDDFPMAFSTIMGCTEGQEFSAKLFEIYNKVFQAALGSMPEDARAMFQGKTLTDLVNQFGPMAAGFGVGLSLGGEDYKDGRIEYLTIKLDYTLLNLPEEAAWVKTMIKSKLEMVVAWNKGSFIMTFGPRGIETAKGLIDGVKAFNPAPVFGDKLVGANFAANINPMPFIDSLRIIPEADLAMKQDDVKPVLDKLAGFKGFNMYSRVIGGKDLWIEMDLGVDSLIPLIAELAKKEMEQMAPAVDMMKEPEPEVDAPVEPAAEPVEQPEIQ